MGIIKKVNSVDMARKMVREWPDAALMERDPFELTYTYGVSRSDADKIIKDERYRRNL
jgi:hypothetical protein